MKTSFALFLLATSASAFVPAAKPASFATSLASSVDDKTEVREYFNTEGFNRWNKIYSESDDVNSVQLDIRNGHDQTIQKILNWIQADGTAPEQTFCDCGCGGRVASGMIVGGGVNTTSWYGGGVTVNPSVTLLTEVTLEASDGSSATNPRRDRGAKGRSCCNDETGMVLYLEATGERYFPQQSTGS